MKSYKWRLYADNNTEKEIVEHLRDAEMDVLWVAENSDLRRQTDDIFHYRKAKELKRYLVTHDADFWDDKRYPLQGCPGLVLLATNDTELGKYLVILLRKLLRDYNPLAEPLFLDGVKIRLTNEGVTIKMVDHDSQKVTNETWAWKELY
jgi:predicted nuclease of predicted toxin-antitoxin system